ncbi:putative nucleotide-sugar transporter [Helianthus annuus]|nr:putative nucleotide-sugar transporter [Helianthus annuus]KAJ0906677.1 putative nucleotide-sugar transporter [Helianthus annuus]
MIFTGFASAALFGHTLTINFMLGISIVFISMHQFFSPLAKVKEEENGVLELEPVENNHRYSTINDCLSLCLIRKLFLSLFIFFRVNRDQFVNIAAGANEEASHRVESDERRPLLPT